MWVAFHGSQAISLTWNRAASSKARMICGAFV
jgi:hypothetical protein